MSDRRLPPPELLMQVANDPDPERFRASFPFVRSAVRGALEQAGHPFDGFRSILDFGCGVGRFLYAFGDDIGPDARLHACDVDAACAGWCRENIDFAETRLVGIAPPLPYEAGQFDLVNAISVFTHLRAELQFRWAWELHRVLRPGGVLLVTTHGIGQLGQALDLGEYFPLREYIMLGAEGLVFALARGAGMQIEGQREVSVAHTRAALEEIFSAWEIRSHVPVSELAGGQALTVLRKPARPGEIVFPSGGAGPADPVPDAIPTGGAASDGVTFPFRLPQSGVFRAGLAFDALRHFARGHRVRYEITKRESGVAVGSGTLGFSVGTFFGPHHYETVTFPVETPGDVDVNLVVQADPGLAASGPIGLRWRFARCERSGPAV